MTADTLTRDGALVDAAVSARVAANRARAEGLEAMRTFYDHRVAEAAGRAGSTDHTLFLLTPLQATKAEFAPVLVVGEQAVEMDLDLAGDLRTYFPYVWEQCLAGRMDMGRAGMLCGYLPDLTSEEDRFAFGKLVEEFLVQRDDPSAPLHPVRYVSLQQAAWRRWRRFEHKSRKKTFAEAFGKRRVRLRTDDDGMSTLSCLTSVDQGLLADYRLTLIAKRRAEGDGEDRTIEQLRADTLVELLLGRLTVTATDGELEDGTAGEGDPIQWHEIGKYARPVVNVTVPITTLMGVSDEPGRLAGGAAVPAELARAIATQPGSTWYRMLTDPAGRFAGLSTDSYTPTAAIWRWVVARDPECVYPGCNRPATVVELDHRTEYPDGSTSTANLQPLCRKHHKVKHSKGFTVTREPDGSYIWRTRFGSILRKPPPELPVPDWPATSPPEQESVMEQAFAAYVAS